MNPSGSLQLCQNSLSTRNRNLTSRLLLRIHNLAIINHQRISRRTLAIGPTKLLRKRGSDVIEEELYPFISYCSQTFQCHPIICPQVIGRKRGNLTYDIIVLNSIRLAPSTHNPRIIESDDSHDIDTLGLDRRQVLDVAWEMLYGAAGGEGAGDGEEDDFFVGPFCRFYLESVR
jgi:hypothetical protein